MSGGVTAELVLVGGGHSHVQVLRSFGMRPMPGVRVTLVTRDVETPYSGMLPGFIAGHYDHDACHIDLMRLAGFAGARLIHTEANGIDRTNRGVLLRDRPSLRYDVLSLDIGSTPRAHDVPGAAEHATAVKPVDKLAGRWDALVGRVLASERALDIVVVGGGAAGVELALGIDHRLRTLMEAEGKPGLRPRVTLVTRGELLAHDSDRVRSRFVRVLAERNVAVLDHAEVVRMEAGAVILADGRRVPFDEALWAVQAGAAPWLRETGLTLDERGFVAVEPTLRSVNDERVFAAGDVAAVLAHPREKAGVFAVRQGPPLTANLRRALAGQPLIPFEPQRDYLKLITTGDRYAVASRGGWSAEGRWAWTLKDWIDRRFMARFQDVPAMARRPMAPETTDLEPRCAGCGAKVPSDVLRRALRRLDAAEADGTDDAAVTEPPPQDRLMVQTVDFFRAFTSDPYLFGRISANHALGDIHAMGAEPLTALAIACVPPGRSDIVEDDLFQMLKGGLDVLRDAGAQLVGGHSAEAGELALGFTLTGSVARGHVSRKGGLRTGDALVLTKPLGTGVLLAAAMRGKARARWIAAALRVMDQPAGPAARCLAEHGATGVTDVTGFGLFGHLTEMMVASGVGVRLDPGAVPVLDGAARMLDSGIRSTLHTGNAAAGRFADGPVPDLLFDPQTAGGLLAGVPADRAAACVAALQRLGYVDAAVIGLVKRAWDGEPRVTLGNLPMLEGVTQAPVPREPAPTTT
ncbi:segregation protein B [Skermanella stibiiresistens SB22]|uniref:Segregation protein B n=1 Tax=Skermanella stibiiresistens SB22 TaxID=1385369 RepID=W9H9C7_9PROT|nr:selenide, water dikinase SelD [Skermanella stibiiresistens]EWY40428.1 segregation protein B [Skermanella stibiiresistens SB22]